MTDVWTLRWRATGAHDWTDHDFATPLEFAQAYYKLWNGKPPYTSPEREYVWLRNGKKMTDSDIEIHSEGLDDCGGHTMYAYIDGKYTHVGWP